MGSSVTNRAQLKPRSDSTSPAFHGSDTTPRLQLDERGNLLTAGARPLRAVIVSSQPPPDLAVYRGDDRAGHECIHLQKLIAFLVLNRLQIMHEASESLNIRCHLCEVTFHNIYLDQLEGAEHAH